MKKLFSLLAASALCASAIVIDGKLDDAEWQNAKKYDGFTRIKSETSTAPLEATTEFSVVSTPDAIYFGIKCKEPLMEQLMALPVGSPWESDAVELFIAPDGSTSEFYQFMVGHKQHTYAMYYAEAGKIMPDPFAPVWKNAVYNGKDFWSVEIAFPLSAFYMTRQNLWKDTWRVNVCRTRAVIKERSTWSPVSYHYNEMEKCKTISGFTMRPEEDDICITTVKANITGLEGGKPLGTIDAKIISAKSGNYDFCGTKIKLTSGVNNVTAKYDFDKEGRNQILLSLKRISDNKDFSRYYPVFAAFVPINVQLSQPEYRNNFYPGQDFSKVTGTVSCIKDKKTPVYLTLEGPGIGTLKKTLHKNKKDFSFDTSNLQEGTAVLTITCGTHEKKVKIQRLKPNGQKMAWISGGNLVVNGKPVLRRNMYAEGYMGGKAFEEKYKADDLCMTRDIGGVSVGTEWQKGLEAKEACKDVYPCKEYIDVLDKAIETAKQRDAIYYYMSDEPECRNLSPIYLQYTYEYLAEKDPYRVVLMGTRACSTYLNCADWFETHPYINPREEDGKRNYDREINAIGNYIDEISLLNRPDKCIGAMPTVFSSRSSHKASRYATFAELVCHTWAFFIRGCKTLYPYAYHDLGDMPDLYEGTRYIFTSANALQDYILLGKRTLLFHTKEAGAATFELKDGRKMFVAVNYTQNPVQVKLKGVSGKYIEFRGDRTFKKFAMELKPHEVIIGTTVKEGANLKNFNDVAKEIDEKNYARLHTGSLLVGHENDIEVTASRPTPRIPYKMFDGTRDVIAFYDWWNKDRYYELSFPNPDFVPTFSKIRIYGNNVGKPTIKINKNNQWLELTPSNVIQEKYMTEYQFAESYSTVKCRINFHVDRMELYEIEMHK